MSEEQVHVMFTVSEGGRERFLRWLQEVDSQANGVPALGFRADDYVSRRAALVAFVDQMEIKLRKNDHKSTWRDKPVDALIRLMLLELEEFKVHHEFFTVAESRPELVDVANFALIVWDRLGLLNQDVPESFQR